MSRSGKAAVQSNRKWLESENTVALTIAERVATLRLNRPDKRNALSAELLREFQQALLEADDRVDVNVIVIEGAGKDFCAGYDLEGAYAGRTDGETSYDPSLYRQRSDTLDNDCWALERQLGQVISPFDLHKPVIAKVHGNCLAGGLDIALSCDIVLVADNAKLGFPAARANGTPAINWWLYQCGPQWTKRMLFTGDILSGRDAARIGLVMDAVPADQLDAEVAELARRISFVDAELLSAHKRSINLGLELMGAKTAQRLATELDARAHLSQGARRSQFRSDIAEHGLKVALQNRDAPFGDSRVRLQFPGD
jgi:enoyl-CoA hydratase